VALVEGDRVWSQGDPEQPIFARSAVKPFQALPLFERGIVDRLQLSDAELALISASHSGSEDHVAVVRGLLERAGLSEGDLGCGPHAPFDRESRLSMYRSGERPGRIHNNCSGKHAGFLLLAQDLGVPLESYLDPDSETQQAVRKAILLMTGLQNSEIDEAVDGCAAPTYRMPLIALARGFARLVNPQGLSDVHAAACRRLLTAVTAEPLLLAGRGRLCTALLRSADGNLYPKNGAEGVYACGLRLGARSFGLAVKVCDGQERGYFPAVVEILQRLGLWQELPAELADFARVPIRNTRDSLVGEVRSSLEFPENW
jgi:L-asparaginase II